MTEINRSLAATLKATGPALIADPGRLKTITETLVAIITKEHPCQKDYGDEEDFSSLEDTSEYDWLAIDTAMDAVIGLATVLGETFGELWKIFQKPIMKYASSSDSVQRSTSVGVIAECIKKMGGQVTPSTSILLKLLLHRMSDEDSETKSNAAYAVGILQEHSGNTQEILKSFPAILAKLGPLLNTDQARCKDNAAGCVSRMILKHRANIPLGEVLPALVDILPLKEDFEENEPVYRMIVQLCESSNPSFTYYLSSIFTPFSPRPPIEANNKPPHSSDSEGDQTIIPLTPQLLPVIAEVMAPEPENQINDETREKLTQLVKFLAGKQPQEVRKYEGLAALV